MPLDAPTSHTVFPRQSFRGRLKGMAMLSVDDYFDSCSPMYYLACGLI
jgi:hypothetical protein